MIDIASLPYRQNAGILLYNDHGQVFTGLRFRNGNEGGRKSWQLPQGGIDPGEDIVTAAKRELYEETNIVSVEFLRLAPDTIKYDLPPKVVAQGWGGYKYRGQEQTWVAFKFVGDEAEIDLIHPANDQPQEFEDWRWWDLKDMVNLASNFRRPVYEQVVAWYNEGKL